jgi:hypothetical protein
MKDAVLPLQSLAFVAVLLSVPALFASPAGSVRGLVSDPSRASVANARVIATSLTTGATGVALSDAAGVFQFLQLVPGTWSVTVEAPRFKRSNIAQVVVQVDQVTHIEVRLEVGDQSDVIQVPGAAPLLEADRSTLSGVVDGQSISSVPLNGRQFLDLALFIPGVVPAAPGTQGSGFSTAGIRSQSNVYLLDGVSNQDTQTNGPLNLFRITEAVQEFAVQTSVPLPEFGRGAGGQVNIVTKSGSNAFHGSAFEYLRNNVLNAADFFTNRQGGTRPVLHRNQFGATLGGPLSRDRTFFFASYEGFRQVAPAVSSTLVPTETQRAGVTDPISRRLLAWWPLPNAGGTTNYISNVRNVDSDNTGLVRLDHRFGANDQLSARWTEYWGVSTVPGPTPLSGGNLGPLSQVSAALSEVHTFSPAALHELRVGVSRNATARSPQDQDVNAAAIFTGPSGTPLPGVIDSRRDPVNAGLPSITVGGGFAALGTNANFPQGRTSRTIEVFENFSWRPPLGGTLHTWRWGWHLRHESLSRYLNRAERGIVNFQTFADFARGQINASTFRTGSTQSDWRRYPWDAYWQDEFRVRPNLSLQFGLRYEAPSSIAERNGRAANYLPGYGLVLAGSNRTVTIDSALKGPASLAYGNAPVTLPPSGVYPDRNNFAPMLGFAWTPRSLSDTVVRGGFRTAYDDLFNNVPASMALNPPLSIQTTQTANVTQPGKFPWELAFDQNVPLISNYGRQGPGTPTVGILTLQGIDLNWKSAFAYLYHLGLQRKLGSAVSVQADFQGSSGHRPGMYIDVNQPAVIVRDAARRGPVAPNEQVFPDNRFNQVQIARPIGSSNYNGLVLTAKYAGRRGVFLQGAYTLGKSLDYNSSFFGSGNLPGETGAPIDARNLRLEHGPSAFDTRQRFVVLWVAELPAPRVARTVLGGWKVSGVATLQSGIPFTVVTGGPDTSGFNQATGGISPNGGNRPDLVKAGRLPQNQRNPDAAFDTTWFAAAPAGRPGTSGRNQYYGPGLRNLDFALAKSVVFRERASLAFRAEFFNALNHTNFANPIADLSNGSFGRITQTLGSAVATSTGTSGGPTGGPRLIQLALRLQF